MQELNDIFLKKIYWFVLDYLSTLYSKGGHCPPSFYLLCILLKSIATLKPVSLCGKKPGRGAYLCHDVECLKRARKTRALERAFEMAIPAEVYDAMERELGGSDGHES